MSGSRQFSTMDMDVFIDFSDPSIYHDTILLVEGKKFHIISALLFQFCNFNEIFNKSKESNEEAIELLGMGAVEFEDFLRALYPLNIAVCDANLASLMRLSTFFECNTVWRRCITFLKNSEKFEKYKARDLFTWSAWSTGGGSLEIKKLIENNLIERSKTFDNQSISLVKESLELSVEYEMDSLMEALEKILFDGRYQLREVIEVIDDLNLVKLKGDLENYLIKCLDVYLPTKYLVDALRNIGIYKLPNLKVIAAVSLVYAVISANLVPNEHVLLENLDSSLSSGRNEYDDKSFQGVKSQNGPELLLTKMFELESSKKQHISKYLPLMREYKLYDLKKILERHLIEVHNKYTNLELSSFAREFGLNELKVYMSRSQGNWY